MRYPTEHKQHTRERILRSAARQFRERGFAETSVASVMKAAELTHGGFYAHFDSKDDLVGEVVRSGFDQVGDRLEARFDHLAGRAWLRAWVDGYLSDEHRERTGEGCPFPAIASEIARSGPAARAAFTEMFHERLDKVVARVDVPRDGAERRVLAAISQMAGALMLSRALEEPLATRIREVASEAAFQTLVGGEAAADEAARGGAS